MKRNKEKQILLRVYPKTVDSFMLRKKVAQADFVEAIGSELYGRIKKTKTDRFALVSVTEAELIAKALGVSTFNLGTSKRYMMDKIRKVQPGETVPVNNKYLQEIVIRYGDHLFENYTNKWNARRYYMKAITLKPETVRKICSEIFAIDGTAEEYTYSKLII